MGSDYRTITAKVCYGFARVQARGIFSPFCVGKSLNSEQRSEPSEDNSVDISRKDLDGDEPVVDNSSMESCSTRKNVEEDLPSEKKSRGKRKASFGIRNKKASKAQTRR